jgi:hypothetical protein
MYVINTKIQSKMHFQLYATTTTTTKNMGKFALVKNRKLFVLEVK